MPICERDPWRQQYFDHVPCPDDVVISTDDIDSWVWYPEHRWIYDKLRIAQSQNLEAAPHGVLPPNYPVFSKPIINLKGMGTGSRRISNAAEMEAFSQAGHFWMPLLEGDHVSTDCAIIAGKLVWLAHATGLASHHGMFRHWTIHQEINPKLQAYLANWITAHMAGYTGMMNFETIGGIIIESHLRFADQWCDLYGDGWVEALVGLYQHGVWTYPSGVRREGYSVPLFAHHHQSFRHPSPADQAAIRALPDVASLQITFYESKPVDNHPMPPGGFRLGLVNGWNLEACKKARLQLAACFPEATLMLPE